MATPERGDNSPRDHGTGNAEPTAAPASRIFTCTNCGASLKFAPGVGKLVCPTCGTHNELPAFDAAAVAAAHEELDYRAALQLQKGNEPAIDAQLVECPQCGAQTRFDPHVVASACAFCATPMVAAKAHVGRQIRPRGIVPFMVEDSAAQALFRKWIQGRWFAPNALRKTVSQAQGVRGVYVPCWTFDAETSSDYDGERGEHRQVRRTSRDASGKEIVTTHTVTDWYSVSGHVNVNFDDALILASASIPSNLAGVLQGWDISKLAPYSDDFVARFTVEAYQLALEPAFEQAQQVFAGDIEAAARRAIGGDEQRVHRVHTEYTAIAFKHLLLPVWICSYKFANKSWRVVVNGQTGAVKGDRPWSIWKIAFAVIGVLAVVIAVAMFANKCVTLDQC